MGSSIAEGNMRMRRAPNHPIPEIAARFANSYKLLSDHL